MESLIEKRYQALVDKVNSIEPGNEKILNDAWEFAKLAHTGVKRKSGDPYITHPLEAAHLLASWGLDTKTIIAGLLHDTIEDGGATREDIFMRYGEEVANLVDGVTKVSNLRLKGSHEDVFVETLRKMILVMARDLRVVFVKLADRMHNMQTLDALPPDKQKKIATETLEIYAPLAERLGIGIVKSALEDLCFKYLYEDEYVKLLQSSKKYYEKAEKHILEMTKEIKKRLAREKLKFEIKGRKKHLYSLWRKLKRKEINEDYTKINDIVALRIVVEKVSDCYVSLGVVHSLYKPVPYLGLSDFIALPKPNGYRSIHTKVFGPEGRIVEVQIRTFEMHKEAEMGAAAHWAYTEAKSKGVSDKSLELGKVSVGPKLTWVRELVAWQKELTSSSEFLNAVKFDALSHRNFVFSPMGDVYDLPESATPVDYAYSVHTKLADYMTGAKVNGKIVPLNFKLKSGDIVEIMKGKHPHAPRRDWLKFVVTQVAKRQLNKRFLGTDAL